MTATALFISNINLLRFSGYFDSQAQLRPLRHTWSLAVEEQFYLVFPLFLAGIWKWQRKRLAPYIALCAIASLALSAWTLHHYPSAAFYLAPTRAYELMTGALLATRAIPTISARLPREGGALVGLGLVFFCAFIFSDGGSFAGINTPLACLGTALMIHTGAGQGSTVARLLSLKPFTFVGGISYALYLWHWPALVFAKWEYLSEVTPFVTLVALSIAFLAALISTSFLERPILKRVAKSSVPPMGGEAGNSRWPPFRVWIAGRSGDEKSILVMAALPTMAFVALGAIFYLAGGFPQRFGPDALRMFGFVRDVNQRKSSCLGIDRRVISYESSCVFGAAPAVPVTAVWGDSFGAELAVAAGEVATRQGQSVMENHICGLWSRAWPQNSWEPVLRAAERSRLQ